MCFSCAGRRGEFDCAALEIWMESEIWMTQACWKCRICSMYLGSEEVTMSVAAVTAPLLRQKSGN